jgi:hypothetical protein
VGAIEEMVAARARMVTRFLMPPKMLLHATPQLQRVRGGWVPPLSGSVCGSWPIDNRPQLAKLPHKGVNMLP